MFVHNVRPKWKEVNKTFLSISGLLSSISKLHYETSLLAAQDFLCVRQHPDVTAKRTVQRSVGPTDVNTASHMTGQQNMKIHDDPQRISCITMAAISVDERPFIEIRALIHNEEWDNVGFNKRKRKKNLNKLIMGNFYDGLALHHVLEKWKIELDSILQKWSCKKE